MNQQEGFFLFYSQDEEKQSSLSSKAGEQGNKSICCLPSPFLNQILWKKVTIWEAILALENKNWLYMSV